MQGDGFGGRVELGVGDVGGEAVEEHVAEAPVPELDAAGFGGWMGFDGGEEFGDAAAFVGDGADDGNVRGFGVEFLFELSGAVAVGFVDDVDAGDFEDAGFDGPQEVEIFSQDNWWKRPGDEVLATIKERVATVC